MIRTQIQLTEAQAQRLKELAKRRDVPMAELIRSGVDKVLAEDDRDAMWQRAMAAVGRYRDSARDVAERHDDYLDDAYGH